MRCHEDELAARLVTRLGDAAETRRLSFGERIGRLSHRGALEQLARRGVLAVIAVRLVPVAPFAIVNMIAGASHIRLRDLLLGTAVGMTPGTVAMMIFMEQIMVALKQPSAGRIWMVALTLVPMLTSKFFANGMQRAGYATDPAYADKLTRVINTTLRLQRSLA